MIIVLPHDKITRFSPGNALKEQLVSRLPTN